MRTPPTPSPPENGLFDTETLKAAGESAVESHIHWLGLSEDPEAMNLRRVLEHCWTLAGDSQAILRKGLLHERWGQHAGALAHLLALGLFDRERYQVTCEPTLRQKAPDLLIERDSFRALVEVRSITGGGESPWHQSPEISQPTRPVHHERNERPRQTVRRESRTRARKLAALRATAQRSKADDLRDVVIRVLEKKASAYRDLCAREDLPYIICLYQDTDDQLSLIVRDWAFGQGDREQDADGCWHSTHDPANGVFFGDRWHFGHVSGIVVFGRLDDEEGRLFMHGDLIMNPFAERPLPASPSMLHLRTYALHPAATPSRMRWRPHTATPFEIAPHP